jgi:hypothetical protein
MGRYDLSREIPCVGQLFELAQQATAAAHNQRRLAQGPLLWNFHHAQ